MKPSLSQLDKKELEKLGYKVIQSMDFPPYRISLIKNTKDNYYELELGKGKYEIEISEFMNLRQVFPQLIKKLIPVFRPLFIGSYKYDNIRFYHKFLTEKQFRVSNIKQKPDDKSYVFQIL
jgi:hypothetical protein